MGWKKGGSKRGGPEGSPILFFQPNEGPWGLPQPRPSCGVGGPEPWPPFRAGFGVETELWASPGMSRSPNFGVPFRGSLRGGGAGLPARPQILGEGVKPRAPEGARPPPRAPGVRGGRVWGVAVPPPARWLHDRGVGASAQPLPHPLPCCGPPKRGGAVGAAAALPRAQRPPGAPGGALGAEPPKLLQF